MISANLIRRISEIDPQLRELLILILEEIEKHTQQIAQQVTKEEFNELKEIVADLGRKVSELAEAQKKTEQKIAELAEAQKKTEEALERTNRQLGGLSRSVAYALENEAYRHLPEILKTRYKIEVIDRFIRTYIADEEINIFAKAKRDGKQVYIVGEAVLKLDDRTKLRWVMDKANLVKEEFGGEVIPIIVTHFARPDVIERANKAGIIVVQSFEW